MLSIYQLSSISDLNSAIYIGESTIWLSFSEAIHYDNSFKGITHHTAIPLMKFHAAQQFLQ